MDQSLSMLIVVALMASGSAQVFMALELRRMRRGLSAVGSVPLVPDGHTSYHNPQYQGVTGSPAGYAIYVYRKDRWEVEADLSTPGHEPTAPTLPGSYEGQVIKKESAPAPGR